MNKNQYLRLDQTAADEFKKSPLCTLSLSSKELFHSNMIGWLLENNPAFASKFFKRDSPIRVTKVEREKYQFDLLVEADGKSYVIENKVKSLPDFDQIALYQEKARGFELEAKFILLTLLEPSDDFKRNTTNLRVVTYEQIHEWISEIVPSDEYSGSLLRDYATLLSTLLRIKFMATNFGMSDPFSFNDEDERILRSIRLFDVAQKIRYSCLADHCEKRLKTLQLRNLDSLKKPTEVALTRSVGLMSIKVMFGKNLLIGIQLQGDQYRFFIESTDKSDVQDLAEILREKELWLNPPDAHREKILKFGKIFKYVYCSVRGESGEDIVNRIADDISRLFRDRRKILDCLEISHDDVEPEPKAWSQDLQQQTRDAIKGCQVSPLDGKLHFKNHDKPSASIHFQDLLNGRLTLSDSENGQIWEFDSTDELLAAGWAID